MTNTRTYIAIFFCLLITLLGLAPQEALCQLVLVSNNAIVTSIDDSSLPLDQSQADFSTTDKTYIRIPTTCSNPATDTAEGSTFALPIHIRRSVHIVAITPTVPNCILPPNATEQEANDYLKCLGDMDCDTLYNCINEKDEIVTSCAPIECG